MRLWRNFFSMKCFWSSAQNWLFCKVCCSVETKSMILTSVCECFTLKKRNIWLLLMPVLLMFMIFVLARRQKSIFAFSRDSESFSLQVRNHDFNSLVNLHFMITHIASASYRNDISANHWKEAIAGNPATFRWQNNCTVFPSLQKTKFLFQCTSVYRLIIQ